jgi:hypothetical protein
MISDYSPGSSEQESSTNLLSRARRSSPEPDRADVLANSIPRVAVQDSEIAELFAHYINVLAPWYDLNDSERLFGTLVPTNSLDCPILFRAVIAFSAVHRYKTPHVVQNIASAFHAACVQDFLQLMDIGEPRSHANELAATCLLRSYEIINGKEACCSPRL